MDHLLPIFQKVTVSEDAALLAESSSQRLFWNGVVWLSRLISECNMTWALIVYVRCSILTYSCDNCQLITVDYLNVLYGGGRMCAVLGNVSEGGLVCVGGVGSGPCCHGDSSTPFFRQHPALQCIMGQKICSSSAVEWVYFLAVFSDFLCAPREVVRLSLLRRTETGLM